MLDKPFVLQRFQAIEDNENQAACSCNSNDLPTSTLSVFSSLNDTRQVKQLQRLIVRENICNGIENQSLEFWRLYI